MRTSSLKSQSASQGFRKSTGLQGEISKSIKSAFVSSFKNSYGKLSSRSSNANNNLQVLNLLALSSLIPSLFSDIVLSAAWLSFPDLLYYLSKDAKAAVATAQREKWSLSRLGPRLSGAANQKQRRDASSAQKCSGWTDTIYGKRLRSVVFLRFAWMLGQRATLQVKR